MTSIKIKAMRNWEIYAVPSFTEFRNFNVKNRASANPELRVNVTEILT